MVDGPFKGQCFVTGSEIKTYRSIKISSWQ